MHPNYRIPRRLGALAVTTLILFMAACGGGSDDKTPISNAGGSGSATASSGTTGSTASPVVGSNAVPITVGAGTSGYANIPTVTITVCAPGTTLCQTIPNVLVDTGSSGLRLVNSAAPGVIAGMAKVSVPTGGSLLECGQFVTSYTWGSVRTADVRIGNLTATAIPIQIVGDQDAPNAPASCTNGSVPANTVADIGANGILGIGTAPYDCGAQCVTSKSANAYYVCASGTTGCQPAPTPLEKQVTNPVPHFSSGNDGVIVHLNPPSGDTATGTLSFGIGNPPSGKTILTTTTSGDVRGTFSGSPLTYAYLDTGSNGYFFDSRGVSNMPGCLSNPFYCPTSTQNLSASLVGALGEQTNVEFSIDNADALFRTGGYALANLGGPGDASTFAFGLPFFYGRTVYIGIDRRPYGSGRLPFVAF